MLCPISKNIYIYQHLYTYMYCVLGALPTHKLLCNLNTNLYTHGQNKILNTQYHELDDDLYVYV